MTEGDCCEISAMVRIHPNKYGDANESAAHIKGVEIAARALGELAQRPSSPVHRVERYWSPPDERTRLDLVGLGVDDKPVVTVEVERPTNDLNTGVPADYDAMADCEPAAAVWLVANRALGHRVVSALVGSSKHEARIPPRSCRNQEFVDAA